MFLVVLGLVLKSLGPRTEENAVGVFFYALAYEGGGYCWAFPIMISDYQSAGTNSIFMIKGKQFLRRLQLS